MTEGVVVKKYTSEQLRILQESGILGFTEKEEFLYVPKVYRTTKGDDGELLFPKEEWPVFKLKGKDGIEIAKLEDKGSYSEVSSASFKDENSTVRIITQSGNLRIETLKSGILGWNVWFRDEKGPIPFRKNGSTVSNDSLKRIPATLQRELAEAINERTYLSPEEKEGLDF